MSSKDNAFTTEETELGTKSGTHVENGQYSKEGYMATAPIDLVAEGKLVRKLDLHIMPLVMCLYLFVSVAMILKLCAIELTLYLVVLRPSQHWQCPLIWNGRRPWSERLAISTGCEHLLRHIYDRRSPFEFGDQEVHPLTVACLYNNIMGHHLDNDWVDTKSIWTNRMSASDGHF